MPQLVERGYIYIAQPPLYKIKAGKDERYLKDEVEESSYMLTLSLKDASLVPQAGAAAISGDALTELAKQYVMADGVIARLSRFMDESTLSAIVGGATVERDVEVAGSVGIQRKRANDDVCPLAGRTEPCRHGGILARAGMGQGRKRKRHGSGLQPRTQQIARCCQHHERQQEQDEAKRQQR
jgi:DNA gyrase/topoisomerase IV subunit B